MREPVSLLSPLWSLSFSKLPHSLRLCCILKKPLDHKCLHTSIVQYYLTSQLWCLNNSQEPCEWVNADLRVLCIESEQIMHLKVGCPNFGPVRGSAILPCMCQPLCIGRVNCLCPDLVLTLCDILRPWLTLCDILRPWLTLCGILRLWLTLCDLFRPDLGDGNEVGYCVVGVTRAAISVTVGRL